MNKTNAIVQIQSHKPEQCHALYNGVVFVVWAFGIYLCACAIRKVIYK